MLTLFKMAISLKGERLARIQTPKIHPSIQHRPLENKGQRTNDQ